MLGLRLALLTACAGLHCVSTGPPSSNAAHAAPSYCWQQLLTSRWHLKAGICCCSGFGSTRLWHEAQQQSGGLGFGAQGGSAWVIVTAPALNVTQLNSFRIQHMMQQMIKLSSRGEDIKQLV